MKISCEVCHKVFVNNRGKKRKPSRFCSWECRIQSKDSIRKCHQCGNKFRVTINSPRKFCSPICSNRYNRHPDPSKKSIFTCKWCGKKFIAWTYRNPTMCSRQCNSEYGARQPKPNQRRPKNFITKNCLVCGNPFTVHKSQDTGNRNAAYCSIECKLKSRVTKPEYKCKDILNTLGIKFKHQHFIKPNFFVDFLVYPNLILQVDGEYWHGHPDRLPLTARQIAQQKRDKAQDKYLTTCGYKVVRVWERDITLDNLTSVMGDLVAGRECFAY